jgi:C4-dicarboxylate-binding protein DctP
MTFSRRQFGGGLTAAALTMAYGRPGWAQSPISIKFSHVVTADAPKGKAAVKFMELGHKYTDGKVKIELYHNSTLYKDKEEVEALQLGAVQMLAPSTAKFAPLGAKEFEALDLPYIFSSDEQYTKVIKGPVGKWLFDKLEPKGLTGLAFWDNGFHMLSANKPLITPADMQGLKVRISGSKISDQYFRKLGAIPQILAFSEVYQALQTGVVDSCENTASNYLTQKFHEVQKHITIAEHAHLQYAVVVNQKYWASLPADIRAGLEKAMAEATDYANSIARQENIDALEEIKKSGKSTIHVLNAAQRKVWRDAMQPTYQWAETRVGKEVIELLLKATAAG